LEIELQPDAPTADIHIGYARCSTRGWARSPCTAQSGE
jgi:hypothetical protein